MSLLIKKKRYSFLAYIGLFILLSMDCLSACKDRSKSTLSRPPRVNQEAINMKEVIELKRRLRQLMKPDNYHYTSEEKIDPFQPFLRIAPKISRPTGKGQQRPKTCSNPLECIDIGQLTLVAIITRPGNKGIAMAQDAAGIGYFLYPGLRVGYQKSKVKKILSDRVIIEEKVKDHYGNLTTRERVMLLHPEKK